MESLLQSVSVDDPGLPEKQNKSTQTNIQTRKDLLSAPQYGFLFNYKTNLPKWHIHSFCARLYSASIILSSQEELQAGLSSPTYMALGW